MARLRAGRSTLARALSLTVVAGLASAQEATPPNTLSVEEHADGWRLLFDGDDLEHWRGFRMPELPPGWVIADGALHFDGREGAEGHGDLTTREQFSDFELRLEWRIAPGGNSGVLFRVSEDHDQEYMTGPEVQVLDADEAYYPDIEDVQKAGANYGLHAASKDVVRPVGEWNALRLIVDAAHVEHWLNGERIVSYELWSDAWKALVAESKFAAWPRYGMNRRGHIVLQDHGSRVWYRNVKIKPLGPSL